MDKKKLITSGVLATLVAVSGQFVQVGTASEGSFFGLQRAEAFGIKLPKIKMPKINIGKGPGMFDISALLGKEETLKRMRKAIEVLGSSGN